MSFFKKLLPYILGILILTSFLYNYKVAETNKYESFGDAWSFINLGLSLAKTGKYGQLAIEKDELLRDFKTGKVQNKKYQFEKHSTWRPPVWPFIIAGIFLIFGYNLTYILIFKFLLHLLGIFIFYKTLKLLNLKRAFLALGTILYAASPTWQLYSRVYLSEPITLFFMGLFIFYLIRYLQHKSSFWIQAVIAGVLILSHPYYIFLPFLTWLLLFLFKQIGFGFVIKASVICSLVVSSWMIRNAVVLQTTSPVITTSSGAVMAKGWNKHVIAKHTNTQGDLADETLVLNNESFKADKNYSEVERSRVYTRAVFGFIKNNPEQIIPIIFTKLKSAFNPFPETPKPGILETGRVIFQVAGFLAMLYVLFFTENRILKAFALSLVLHTVLIGALTYSGFRFRMPQTVLEILFIIISVNQLYYRHNPNINKSLDI